MQTKSKTSGVNVMERAENFVSSEKMMPVLGLFVVLCHMCDWAIVGFTGLGLVFIFIMLSNAHIRGVIPVLLLVMYVISDGTGGATAGAGSFGGAYFLDYIVYLAILLIGALVSLVYGLYKRRMFKLRLSPMWFGVAAMALSFVSGGLFYPDYSMLSLAIGAGFAVYFMLFFMLLSCIAPAVTFDYLSKAVLTATLCLLIQLLALYYRLFFLPGAVEIETSLLKNYIALGWGKSNNIGIMIALGLPFSAYEMAHSKRVWYGLCLCVVQLTGVILTFSRAAMLVAVPAAAAGIVYALIKTKGRQRALLSVIVSLALFAGVFFLVFKEQEILRFFDFYIENGFDDRGRFPLYQDAWETFLKYPLFGAGLAYKLGERVTIIYFAHNTVLQFMMNGGLVGLLAVLMHIASVLYAALRRPNEKRWLLICAAALIFCHSMLDCVWYFPYAMLYYMLFITVAEFDALPARKSAGKDAARRKPAGCRAAALFR